MPQETNAVMLLIVIQHWYACDECQPNMKCFLTAFYKEDIFVISYIFVFKSLVALEMDRA